MRFVPLFLGLAACGLELSDPTPIAVCEGLFGTPNENTGLDASACAPRIDGVDESWVPAVWDDVSLADLRARTLLDPLPTPEEDPYEATPDVQPDETSVCAVVSAGGGEYRLLTYPSAEEAAAGRGHVTHGGACGTCSSLQDLAVYAENGDLTQPVRQCGLQGLGDDFGVVESCLIELGFTAPCARIWAFNVRHTQQTCFGACISALDDPYHLPDGSLNECLQCDEDESGPVFKAVAGRTRRNSGLATALCRPCETVWRIDHVLPGS